MRKAWCIVLMIAFCLHAFAQTEKLVYHNIKTDSKGFIIPWYSDEPGKAWSHTIQLAWNFWDTMRRDMNGVPYYMNHQVWKEHENDPRGLGGDQLNMALSSWKLLYAYTGNERIKENMKFIADYYLTHALSPANAAWPDIPFPYNTLVYSGTYDGDMVIGKNFTQPDKAGAFGMELVHLYKMTSNERYPNNTAQLYLDAAIKIANTLVKNVKEGDENNSPLPFKLNAITGETGVLKDNARSGKDAGLSSYTSNWSGTLDLLLQLQQLGAGDTTLYKNAFEKIIRWMKTYPLKNNKWGPFFEDIPGWSDTQINAVTFAQFMMNHREYFPNWKTEVKKIFDWVYEKLGNKKWEKYGVVVVNEQTAYQQPGNSHSSRQASAEMQYMALTGDRYHYDNAVRQLNWATYMMNVDGRNFYPNDDIWLTDGYGDYVRHYLRAMAAMPELAPSGETHLLGSSAIVQHVFYKGQFEKYFPPLKNSNAVELYYRTYEKEGTEIIRVEKKPSGILFDGKTAMENNQQDGYTWKPLSKGGVITIQRSNTHSVTLLK
jgi:hypothetical protein